MEYSANKVFNASAEIADSMHCELDSVCLPSTLTNRAMGMVAQSGCTMHRAQTRTFASLRLSPTRQRAP
jgi:hypothetical protein